MGKGYLAFDPGGTTGWARFSDEGVLETVGQCIGQDELFDFLKNAEPPTGVIYEDYKLFKHRAVQQSGSSMPASQAIGMIITYARIWEVHILVKQPSSIKPIAEKWSQVKPVGAHKDTHWIDAYNHGVYFLQKEGIRKSILLGENADKEVLNG